MNKISITSQYVICLYFRTIWVSKEIAYTPHQYRIFIRFQNTYECVWDWVSKHEAIYKNLKYHCLSQQNFFVMFRDACLNKTSLWCLETRNGLFGHHLPFIFPLFSSVCTAQSIPKALLSDGVIMFPHWENHVQTYNVAFHHTPKLLIISTLCIQSIHQKWYFNEFIS